MITSPKTSHTIEKKMEPAFYLSVHPQTQVSIFFFFALLLLLYDGFYNNDQRRLGKSW